MWIVKRTDTFLRYVKKHRNNHPLLTELDKKIKRLQEDPFIVGGNLAGNLHGHRSTRLVKNFRLVFSVDEDNNTVFLYSKTK